jgi:toxin ParE1/3/4
MARYRLSRRAAADVDEIAEYSIKRFGIRQARRYRDRLEKCFQTLAENPRLGRSAEQLAPDLRRFENESQIVFYIIQAEPRPPITELRFVLSWFEELNRIVPTEN